MPNFVTQFDVFRAIDIFKLAKTNMNTKKIISKMKKLHVPIRTDDTFSRLTTFGVGGTIEVTTFPQSITQLVRVVRYLQKHKVPYYVLGKGSNVLAGDSHFKGVVICTKKLCQVHFDGVSVTAECGTSTAKVARLCVAKGLTGGEFLACLPASVGGVVSCNAGCFGQCVQNVIHSVMVLHKGKIKTLKTSECNFSHRSSIFKNGNYVILQATFCMQKSSPFAVSSKIQQFKTQKSQTQPLGQKSAGCVLCNSRFATSQLIDKAGLKGYRIGGAEVSKKHAGFVINIDKATAKDIYLLILHVKQVLLQIYNVNCNVELNLVNFTEDNNDLFAIDQTGNSQNASSS